MVDLSRYFLNVANAHSAASRRLETICAREVKIDAVFEIQPFLVIEKRTPPDVAEGNGLVATQLLSIVDRGRVPMKAISRRIEPFNGICGILLYPGFADIGPCRDSEVVIILGTQISAPFDC